MTSNSDTGKKDTPDSKNTIATNDKPQSHPTKKTRRLNWNLVRYTFFLLIWVAIAMTVSQFIVGLPLIWILKDGFNETFWTCVYYGLTYILSLVLIIIVPPKVISWLKKSSKVKLPKKTKSELPKLQTSRKELGLNNLPTVIDVGLAPIAYVIYLVISSVFMNAMSAFSWFNAEETQDTGFGYFITSNDRIIAMIAIVFIAPIAEEIIMRGWLYGKLRERLNFGIAILLTSTLFALLHGQWNVGVSTFALSLVLCGLREITGTIWSGILLHMLTNGIAFYLLFIAF